MVGGVALIFQPRNMVPKKNWFTWVQVKKYLPFIIFLCGSPTLMLDIQFILCGSQFNFQSFYMCSVNRNKEQQNYVNQL